MRKILFPFELDNPVYREAYIYGIKFARRINAELILLHVFLVHVGDDITEEKYGKLLRENWFKAYNEISKFNRYFLEQHASTDTDLKVKFNYRFVNGILLDEIKNITREDEVDLIVLPVSDDGDFNNRQMKIIRDNVFEKNRTSLLTVPHGCDFRPVRNIVFATDLKKLHNYQLYIHDVLNYARIFDSNVHFLHVAARGKAEAWESSQTYQLVKQAIEKNPRHLFKSLHGQKILESVNQYAQECEADLLVVVRHQHAFLESIFHESISKGLSLNARVPVLVMREKRSG